MLGLLFSLIAFIAALLFYQLIGRACRAIITMSCSSDHGHGVAQHWGECVCPCHKAVARAARTTPVAQ